MKALHALWVVMALAQAALATEEPASLVPVPPVEETQGAPEQAPQAPPQFPAGAVLEQDRAKLQGFLDETEGYVRKVHSVTERFRMEMQQVKKAVASCEVQHDLAREDAQLFPVIAGMVERHCGYARNFDQVARRYAARLDEAVGFQKRLERLAEQVRDDLDRIAVLRATEGLAKEVDTGLATLEQWRKERFKPWTGSTTP